MVWPSRPSFITSKCSWKQSILSTGICSYPTTQVGLSRESLVLFFSRGSEHRSLLSLVSLFFTYRWLLLECKREFPFNDALRVLEVMWATLPIDSEPPSLSEKYLLPFSSTGRLSEVSRPRICRSCQRRALSCPSAYAVGQACYQKRRPHSTSLAVHDYPVATAHPEYRSRRGSEQYQRDTSDGKKHHSASTSSKSREKSLENSFSLSEISAFDSDNLSSCSDEHLKILQHISQDISANDWLQRLPATDAIWLEEENSFLLFLCVSLLLSHRQYLLKQKNLDEQEISMHFDRYRRRHHADRLLPCARTLYTQYIQWSRKKRMLEDLNSFSAN